VRELFAQHGERVQDLEVKRASLEDTYMAMVHRDET
jgi:ABC-2 type transport system ATP-binding protein